MRLTRLFHAGALATGDRVVLLEAAAQHIRRVLRARLGDTVLLFNGTGREFRAEIAQLGERHTDLTVLAETAPAAAESPVAITLVQGVSRGERMDFVLQKATELGVTAIAPVLTERSVVRLDGAQARRRLEHWRAITIAACEQCGRTVLPVLEPVAPLPVRLGQPAVDRVRVMLTPDGDRSLADTAKGAMRIELLIGPEGGLSAAEQELARKAGFTGATLGPRVLRTETAALAALAVVQQIAGDLGSKR